MEEIRKKGHFVEIRNELYDKIKQYCQLNNLKVVKFINETLEKSFMVELYGEPPFSTTNMFYKPEEMVQIPPEIQRVIADHWWEMLGDDEKHETLNAPSHDLSVQKEEVPVVEMVTPTGALLIVNETIPVMEERMPNGIVLSAFSDTVIEQTPESQSIIDEHMKKLEEKSNKPIKRRLK